ncbi:MAG: molybdopterin-dependent oxidoreductase [Spirochaetales bacterium]|jgi:DMSO/TMAO reductase YedYZ molybdopterin-dependent catalytic subunit|nr:molybdopterin-dependent oxidoreductase [Exilispira sp.]NMC67821.1 molybdopterin-dependent oxidoreductase [Spirochaetales bacterium]
MKYLTDYGTPIFWAEGHPGILNKENWEIEVTGLVEKPTILSWSQLMNLPSKTVKTRLTSVTRWSIEGDWTGISISEIAKIVNMKKEAKFLRAISYRNIYDTTIDINIAFKERTILAYKFNGFDLTEDYGGPIRLLVPYLWGYKSAKSIVKIEFTDIYKSGYWEKRGYTDHASFEKTLVRDLNDNGRLKPFPDEFNI